VDETCINPTAQRPSSSIVKNVSENRSSMLTSDRLVLVIVTLVSQVDHVKVSTIFHPNLDTLVERWVCRYASRVVEISVALPSERGKPQASGAPPLLTILLGQSRQSAMLADIEP
jgi:hypothetical protein